MLDVQELDVEEELVAACARCQRIVLLLDVLLGCVPYCYFLLVVEELSKLSSEFLSHK